MDCELYAKKGGCFRNNMLSWSSLWAFVAEHCSDVLTTEDVERGGGTYGHVICEKKALRLADRLDDLILEGVASCEEFFSYRRVMTMPLADCPLCSGSASSCDARDAIRISVPLLDTRNVDEPASCGCREAERVQSHEALWPFREDNVREFAAFCRTSGGFAIR